MPGGALYAIAVLIAIPTGLFVVGVIAFIFLAAFLLSGIFAPAPKYDIANRDQLPSNDSPEFLLLVESMVDAKVNRTGTLEILKNRPPCIPPSWMRSAMRAAV